MTSRTVQTVLGPIEPERLGVTLTHEHLSMDYTVRFRNTNPAKSTCPITLENIGWIRQNPYSHKGNLTFNDLEANQAVQEDMLAFKAKGGATIVENTTSGLTRDVRFLREVALASGVNVVAGAGFYVGDFQTAGVLALSTEQLADVIRTELSQGCDGTDIRAGFIGEIASVYPMHAFERRVLQATATVQQELGCAVMVHPDRHPDSPYETSRVYLEAGGDPTKLVMAHLDRTYFDASDVIQFAQDQGTMLELDLFGVECSYYQLNPAVDMASDAQRIRMVAALMQAGLQDRVVISQDIATKHRLAKFGGHGYSHVLTNVAPKMLTRGVTQDQLDRILIHNPRRWLSG